MTWSDSVREQPQKIYTVWRELTCGVSYWSTLNNAVGEVSRILGVPRDQLMFEKTEDDEWKIDGDKNNGMICINEIELDKA